MSKPIRTAIVGVGNCASSLVQGIAWYAQRPDDTVGLDHPVVGGYRVSDIEIVAAFDIDARKVARPLHQAIFAPPNNTKRFCESIPASKVIVQMGEVLDGVAPHMQQYPPEQRFEPAKLSPADVAAVLRDAGAEVLVNYLPVGSQNATEFYADACLKAGVGFVNCIPVFIASDATWSKRFADAKLPCVGDDIKAQLGATITHRTLARLCAQRGIKIERTYQLNVGGNADFLNMLSRDRVRDKRASKTDAVRSEIGLIKDGDIHIGPSDFVPFLHDNKVCFIRIEGRGFGNVPVEMDLRLSVEDSPNSAGMVVDAIRAGRIARDRGLSGAIDAPSAWTMKHPPTQMSDEDARRIFEQFISQR